MDGVAKLRGRRRLGIVEGRRLIAGYRRLLEHVVVGLVAVRAPEALELSCIGVHGHDARVEVSVGDEGLVRLGIDHELCGPAEALHVQAIRLVHARGTAAASIARLFLRTIGAAAADQSSVPLAHLHEELSFLGELQQVGVATGSATDPDIPLVVDREPMLLIEPLIAGPSGIIAPVSEQIPGLIELEDSGGRRAAHRPRRVELELFEVGGQRPRAAIENPDVVLPIDGYSAEASEDPVIGQRLRPERIDLEHGRLDCALPILSCRDARFFAVRHHNLVGLKIHERLRPDAVRRGLRLRSQLLHLGALKIGSSPIDHAVLFPALRPQRDSSDAQENEHGPRAVSRHESLPQSVIQTKT